MQLLRLVKLQGPAAATQLTGLCSTFKHIHVTSTQVHKFAAYMESMLEDKQLHTATKAAADIWCMGPQARLPRHSMLLRRGLARSALAPICTVASHHGSPSTVAHTLLPLTSQLPMASLPGPSSCQASVAPRISAVAG